MVANWFDPSAANLLSKESLRKSPSPCPLPKGEGLECNQGVECNQIFERHKDFERRNLRIVSG